MTHSSTGASVHYAPDARPPAREAAPWEATGRSSDAGHLGRDMALLGIPVIAAVTIMLAALRPASANRASD